MGTSLSLELLKRVWAFGLLQGISLIHQSELEGLGPESVLCNSNEKLLKAFSCAEFRATMRREVVGTEEVWNRHGFRLCFLSCSRIMKLVSMFQENGWWHPLLISGQAENNIIIIHTSQLDLLLIWPLPWVGRKRKNKIKVPIWVKDYTGTVTCLDFIIIYH